MDGTRCVSWESSDRNVHKLWNHVLKEWKGKVVMSCMHANAWIYTF